MRLPIQLALTYPDRLPCPAPRLDLLQCGELSFQAPDLVSFPCLADARQAAKQGGTACAVLNGANEVAVAAYLAGRIGFYQIHELVAEAMASVAFLPQPTLDEILAADAAARDTVNRKL